MRPEPARERSFDGEYRREEELSELQERLDEATKKAEEYISLAQRVQADFQNYKRRIEQEREDQARYAHGKLILKLLPVLDDFDRAIDSVKAELAGLHWVQGVGHIRRKLQNVLEGEGLAKVEALGHEFDPRLHEAVVYEEVDPEEDGTITAVLQPGYRLHERVIRPAMVKVGKATTSRRAPGRGNNSGARFSEEDWNA
jgi:molecular chaperone GrpE